MDFFIFYINRLMQKAFSLALLLSAALQVYAQRFPDSWNDGKYVVVNGAKLWVVTVGQGDPLIIIPGGPGGYHLSYRSFDSLAGNNMIVYYDAFGRGKLDTAKDLKEYSLERDIEDLEGLRAGLHLDKINVLGHSYGGLVAQDMH